MAQARNTRRIQVERATTGRLEHTSRRRLALHEVDGDTRQHAL